MISTKQHPIKWLAEPEDHDYPAARSYLSLILKPGEAKAVVAKLKKTGVIQHPAKDLFRASRLPLLDLSNSHVEKDKARIDAGEKSDSSSSWRTVCSVRALAAAPTASASASGASPIDNARVIRDSTAQTYCSRLRFPGAKFSPSDRPLR